MGRHKKEKLDLYRGDWKQGSQAEYGTMLIYREQKYIIRSSMEYSSVVISNLHETTFGRNWVRFIIWQISA